jgi:hypothetical protein
MTVNKTTFCRITFSRMTEEYTNCDDHQDIALKMTQHSAERQNVERHFGTCYVVVSFYKFRYHECHFDECHFARSLKI